MAFKKEVIEIIEPRDIFVGNVKAEITLEEFGEYESEVCANANEIVKKFFDANSNEKTLQIGFASQVTFQTVISTIDGRLWGRQGQRAHPDHA